MGTDKGVDSDVLHSIQQHFHALIRERAGQFVDDLKVELPQLSHFEARAEQDGRTWFGVPGMYGGFSYWFEGAGKDAKLIAESWSRVVGGSGQRHEITAAGATLVEEGFV